MRFILLQLVCAAFLQFGFDLLILVVPRSCPLIPYTVAPHFLTDKLMQKTT